MTLTEKLIGFMEELDKNGIELSRFSGTFILQRYYEHIGMEPDLPVGKWFDNILHRKYPAFASITRAIRKARELNPKWKKDPTWEADQIEEFKFTVGY